MIKLKMLMKGLKINRSHMKMGDSMRIEKECDKIQRKQ